MVKFNRRSNKRLNPTALKAVSHESRAGRRVIRGVMPLKTSFVSRQGLSRMRKRSLFWGIFCAAVVLNFVAYLVGQWLVGGDAVGGKVEGGHYFVWGYLNHSWAKGYKEVSRELFTYCKWHGYSVLISWPSLIITSIIKSRLSGVR